MKRFALFLLFASFATSLPALDWNREYSEKGTTVIATKVEKPANDPFIASLWTAPDGFFISVKSDDPAVVEFVVYVVAKLSEGRLFVRSQRVEKRLDGPWTWAWFKPGRCSEIISVSVEKIPPPDIAEFQ